VKLRNSFSRIADLIRLPWCDSGGFSVDAMAHRYNNEAAADAEAARRVLLARIVAEQTVRLRKDFECKCGKLRQEMAPVITPMSFLGLA
jgi:hypothetical protein